MQFYKSIKAVCECVFFRPPVKSPSLSGSGAPYGFTTTPPWLSAWDCWVPKNWCACGISPRVFVCVRAHNCNKSGYTVFSHYFHKGLYWFLTGTKEGMVKRCLNESSISWKPLSCHFRTGCMWCWFKWIFASSAVKIFVDSSHQSHIAAFAI